MRTIALVGAGPSREPALRLKESRPEVEVWALNRLVLEDVIKPDMIDRLYEIHPLWYILGEWNPYHEEYGAWLNQQHPFDVVAFSQDARIPSSITYPIEGVVRTCFPDTWRGRKKARYLTTTFSMMLGHAIYEHKALGRKHRIARIEMYGFDMAAEFEYAYQKPGAHRLVGHCEGLGIQLYTPHDCQNFDAKLYGYEVNEMVPRQAFEEYKLFYQRKLEEFKAKMNKHEAEATLNREKWRLMSENGASEDEIDKQNEIVREYADNWLFLNRTLAKYDAAVQLCDKFIGMCDLQEPDQDFIDTVGRLPFTGYEEYAVEPPEELETA